MTSELQRISTAEAVVNHFKELISTGTLKPGDALPSERALQAELGISRFALREGLARLSALGLITCAQGRASTVNGGVDRRRLGDAFTALAAEAPERWSEELFAARRLIEVEAAGLAAEERSAAQLAALRALADQLAGSLEDGEAYARIDLRFHHALVEAAGNRFLDAIHGLLQDQLQAVVVRTVARRGHRTASLEGHRRILAAVAAGDAAGARAAMTAHLDACHSAYRA